MVFFRKNCAVIHTLVTDNSSGGIGWLYSVQHKGVNISWSIIRSWIMILHFVAYISDSHQWAWIKWPLHVTLCNEILLSVFALLLISFQKKTTIFGDKVIIYSDQSKSWNDVSTSFGMDICAVFLFLHFVGIRLSKELFSPWLLVSGWYLWRTKSIQTKV